MKRIIKRSRKPNKKLSNWRLNQIRKIIVKLNGKLYKEKNYITYSNHKEPYSYKRSSPSWKFYPYCMINLNGNFGYVRFALGKKNSIQKKRENDERKRLDKLKLKYPTYYDFNFDDDKLIFSFKYKGVFDDIDSGNGEYNVNQNFDIKFERPIDYKNVKECIMEYLVKDGKGYQPK